MITIFYLPRIVLFFVIIFSFEQFFDQNAKLKENLDGLTLWNNTKNLYNLYETYSPYYVDDLAAEDIVNDKFFKVYKELSDLDKVFIIKTTNFERLEKDDLFIKSGRFIFALWKKYSGRQKLFKKAYYQIFRWKKCS